MFGDLSKREIKEIIRDGRNSDFDWFGERQSAMQNFEFVV